MLEIIFERVVMMDAVSSHRRLRHLPEMSNMVIQVDGLLFLLTIAVSRQMLEFLRLLSIIACLAFS